MYVSRTGSTTGGSSTPSPPDAEQKQQQLLQPQGGNDIAVDQKAILAPVLLSRFTTSPPSVHAAVGSSGSFLDYSPPFWQSHNFVVSQQDPLLLSPPAPATRSTTSCSTTTTTALTTTDDIKTEDQERMLLVDHSDRHQYGTTADDDLLYCAEQLMCHEQDQQQQRGDPRRPYGSPCSLVVGRGGTMSPPRLHVTTGSNGTGTRTTSDLLRDPSVTPGSSITTRSSTRSSTTGNDRCFLSPRRSRGGGGDNNRVWCDDNKKIHQSTPDNNNQDSMMMMMMMGNILPISLSRANSEDFMVYHNNKSLVWEQQQEEEQPPPQKQEEGEVISTGPSFHRLVSSETTMTTRREKEEEDLDHLFCTDEILLDDEDDSDCEDSMKIVNLNKTASYCFGGTKSERVTEEASPCLVTELFDGEQQEDYKPVSSLCTPNTNNQNNSDGGKELLFRMKVEDTTVTRPPAAVRDYHQGRLHSTPTSSSTTTTSTPALVPIFPRLQGQKLLRNKLRVFNGQQSRPRRQLPTQKKVSPPRRSSSSSSASLKKKKKTDTKKLDSSSASSTAVVAVVKKKKKVSFKTTEASKTSCSTITVNKEKKKTSATKIKKSDSSSASRTAAVVVKEEETSSSPSISRHILSQPSTEDDLSDENDKTEESTSSSKKARNKPKRQGPPHFRRYQAENWSLRFRQLQEFVKKTGHATVPHDYPPNQGLSRWAKRQRYQYKLYHQPASTCSTVTTNNNSVDASAKSTAVANGDFNNNGHNNASAMTAERIRLLDNMGFCWDIHAALWKERFQELVDYQKEFGNVNVPSKFPQNKKLATWVKCQRRQYKLWNLGRRPANITQERIDLLNSIGFRWSMLEPPEAAVLPEVGGEVFAERGVLVDDGCCLE